MYHYIRDNCAQYPHFKKLNIDQFRKQLDFFDKTYGFLSKEQFIESIDLKVPIDDGIILTFDDGFKDHYQNVLPILEENGLWGVFLCADRSL